MVITPGNVRRVIIRNSCSPFCLFPRPSWFGRASHSLCEALKQKRSLFKCSLSSPPRAYQPWRRSQSSACRREQHSEGFSLPQHPGPWNSARQAVDRRSLSQDPRMHRVIEKRLRAGKDRWFRPPKKKRVLKKKSIVVNVCILAQTPWNCEEAVWVILGLPKKIRKERLSVER